MVSKAVILAGHVRVSDPIGEPSGEPTAEPSGHPFRYLSVEPSAVGCVEPRTSMCYIIYKLISLLLI